MATINIGTLEALIRLRDEMSPGMKNAIKTMKDTAVVIGALAGAAAVATKALQAQAAQEGAINKLNLALANQGKFTAATSKSLVDYSAAMQDTSTFADEVILSGEAMLASFGMNEEQIKSATQAALDYSAATGTDLESSVQLLGKAFVGNTTALGKLGFTFDEGMTKAQKFDSAIAQMEGRFGGSALAATQTYAGGMKQLENAWGDAMEGLGKFLGEVAGSGAPFSILISAAKSLTKFLGSDLVIALSEARALFAGFMAGLLETGATFADFIKKISGGKIDLGADAMREMAAGQRTLQVELRAAGDAAAAAAGKTQTYANNLRPLAAGTEKLTEAVKKLNKEIEQLQREALAAGAAEIRALNEEWFGGIKEGADELESVDWDRIYKQAFGADAVEELQIRGIGTVTVFTRSIEALEDELEILADNFEEDSEEAERFRKELEQLEKALEWEKAAEDLRGIADTLDQLDGLFAALGVSADSAIRQMTQGFADLADSGAQFAKAMASGNIFDKISAGVGLATSAVKLLSGAWKSLFGDREWERVNDMRDEFVAAAGGIDKLNQRAVAAGLSLDRLLDAKKVKDYEEAVEMLNLQLEFIEGRGGLRELEAAAEQAGISLQAMFDAKSAEALKLAIDDIGRGLDTWTEAMRLTQEAMDKYGITVDQMGAKFAQQKLDEQAMQLFQDYSLLTAAGADHNLVLEKMAPSINEYVQTALRAGSSIPESMRPIIDAMIANGQLLDENGNAYASAEEAGITYAMSTSEAMKLLIESINDLVNALRGIPKNVNTNVNTNYTTSGSPPGDPGEHHGGEHHAAHGFHGMVYRPTRFLVGEAGPERLDVTPAGGGGAGGAGGGGMGGGGINLQPGAIVINGYNRDPQELAQEVARRLYGGHGRAHARRAVAGGNR